MSRGRQNYPADLDVLDSPLVSASPFSALGGIPGSALAERIFNDPDSWEDTDGDEGDYPEDVEVDTFEWLTEEIEKIRAHSSGIGANSIFDLSAPQKRDSKEAALVPPPGTGDSKQGLKGIARRSGVRPISLAALFENSGDDFSGDIQQQLSKILESSGIKHHIGPRPLSSALSPPSSSGSMLTSASTVDSLPSGSSFASSSAGDMSPIPPIPTSATLSFLEYYGIYPESPLIDASGRKSLLPRKKSMRQKNPHTLQVPSSRLPSRPSSISTVTPSSAGSAETFRPTRPKRNTSVPPPGLVPPADLSKEEGPSVEVRPSSPPGLRRSPSPPKGHQRQGSALPQPPSRQGSHDQVLEILLPPRSDYSPRSRPLPTAAPPPPYARTPSPDQSPPSRSGTPFRHLPSASTPVRRLPSIPPEVSSQSSTSVTTRNTEATPQAQLQAVNPKTVIAPRLVSRHTAPVPPHARAPLPPPVFSPPAKTGIPASFASLSSLASGSSVSFSPVPPNSSCASATSQFGGRPSSTVRSPIVIGPRTRSRNASGDAGRPVAPSGHRPPVLRL